MDLGTMRRSRWIWLAVTLAVGCKVAPPPPQKVRLAYQHELVTLDPHNHNDSTTGTLLSAVYEPLVSLDPVTGMKPVLAVEWSNPSPTLWRFRLRPGALFHDGRPLSADDVVASFRRVRFDLGLTVATFMDVVADVRKAADSPDTVEVLTNAPSPLLLHRIGMVAIAPQFFDPQRPIGTGPYRWESGRERGPITLRRWEKYWGTPAPMPEVAVSFVPPDDQLDAALQTGQLDVMSGVSLEFLRRHTLPAGWKVAEIPTLGTTMLGINVTRPFLRDPRVREAIELAIDPEALGKEAFPQRGGAPAWMLLPAQVFGADPAQRRQPPNQVRARLLLRAAGVDPTTELDLLLLGVDRGAVDWLVRALGEVGLRVNSNDISYELAYRRMMGADTELFTFGWNFRLADPADFLDSMVHSRDAQRRLGLQNGSGYASDDVDARIEAYPREPDDARRLALVHQVFKDLGRDRPYLPLYHHTRFALVRQPFLLGLRAGLWALPQEIRIEAAD
jgi:peptide/nickel transport system substrate-binding protein